MAKLWCSLILLGLTACASAPPMERPAPPVPPTWPLAQSPGNGESAKTHWRSYFTDPQLQALIAVAIENNRDLRIALARVQEARAQFGIAKADRLPSVGLLGTGSVTNTPSELTNAGTAVVTQRYDLTASLLSYEFDFWGRIAGLTEAAKLSYLATEEAQRSVQISLVADVANAYFSVLEMRELMDFARQNLESREKSLAVVEKGRDIGAAFDFEYQQSLSFRESARSSLEGTQHQLNVAMNRLQFLVGHATPQVATGLTLSEQRLGAELSAGLPSEVLLQRPDVIGAEHRLQAAHANIGAARAAFFPRLLLTAGAGFASQGLIGLFRGASWNFQPNISLPLFDGGRGAAGLDVAEARKVIAVAEYEKTIQLAFREVSDLLSARSTLVRQYQSATLNLSAQYKRLQIVRARYNAGLIGYLEVLEGDREFGGAQQALAQIRHAQLETATQLYKALGGGGAG